ncbi:YceD family protein [Microcoleus sp. FACHB-672]|uniref:YceD family protein n=1 Tax=Microcoleus sp. FACHB-672 TaxID=2692825 RepID=UPI00168852E4|nr:YceD family protein [Microcoleus sp. FACHB-672]MBD2040265.1 DUF177 domain-containing protein [Microcoleus sp. FACHB-672]
MEAIYIPQLIRTREHTEVVQFEEFLPDLETLTPLRGQMKVTHNGNYLEVCAQAETIITLTCHRCLQQYNHRLKIKPSELIWLEESTNGPDTGPQERETALEDLVETLPPQGYFEPSEWLYQQVCLAIPHRQLCDSQCKGIQLAEDEGGNVSEEPAADQRWSALEALKRQLPK